MKKLENNLFIAIQTNNSIANPTKVVVPHNQTISTHRRHLQRKGPGTPLQ
jgi:hypothetical protein